MIETRFEWDKYKTLTRQRKHGVSFEQAARAFADPLAVSFKEREVEGEERWQIYGKVEGLLLLLIAHTVCTKSPSKR